MVIQIDGVNTKNKGAELMLVAILEVIEKRFPGAIVWLNANGELDESFLPIYNLKFKRRLAIKKGKLVRKILNKLGVRHQYFSHFYAKPNIDYVLDASGFQYSDQWNHSELDLNIRERYYKQLKEYGAKLIFLPQALGPFNSLNGKESVRIMSTYCDLIFARDKESFDYFLDAGGQSAKVLMSCDFTFLTSGVVEVEYSHLQDYVCIIPNQKMITHTNNNNSDYLMMLIGVVEYLKLSDEKVFLLNHEGEGDYRLCQSINSKFDNLLPIVSGLSAKSIKGVIGNSKLVISSRFHGVASALSQSVPCLATSWNHKYEMLFKDFNQEDCILNPSEPLEVNIARVKHMLNMNSAVVGVLKEEKEKRVVDVENMWLSIFDY